MNKLKTLIIMTIYKSPYCGCCSAWTKQIVAAGFEVTVIEQADNNALHQAHAITPALTSCHTAIIGDYVLEGHVPAADIQRMLKEKPAIASLAVPGMPASFLGMDVPGNTDPYQVIAF